MNFNLDYTLPVSVSVVLDIIVVLIGAYCAWRGWRKGIIGGLCAIMAIIVSFYGANLVASTYSSEFTGIVKPFANGIIDKMVDKVTGTDDADDGSTEPVQGFEETDEMRAERDVVVQLSKDEKSDVYSVAFAVLRQLGVNEKSAAPIAEEAVKVANFVNNELSDYLAAKLCDIVAYIGVFIIAFILIAIVFAVVGNILDLVFSLPGIELVNKILGLCLGLVKAFCILQFLGCIARYTGIIISDETIAGTWFFKYFVENNYLASYIGL